MRSKAAFFLPFLVAAIFLCTPSAFAQVWIASTGTVDPASASLVTFTDGRVELKASAPVGSVAKIRYNVLPVGDLNQKLTDIEFRQFAVRFLDNGEGARVLLTLKQYNMSTGLVTTLMTFDSNLSAPSSTYQEASSQGNPHFDFTFGDSQGFNPNDSGYFIEAQLIRTAAGGKAGLGVFSIKLIVP
jgi:hypothetical protein